MPRKLEDSGRRIMLAVSGVARSRSWPSSHRALLREAVTPPARLRRAVATPTPAKGRHDPCGGQQELLKEIPGRVPSCVFVVGQASLQATLRDNKWYPRRRRPRSGAYRRCRLPCESISDRLSGELLSTSVYLKNAQITILPPSFSQLSSSSRGTLDPPALPTWKFLVQATRLRRSRSRNSRRFAADL